MNFVVYHTDSDYIVNFVVNPQEQVRSLNCSLAGATDRGYPYGR